MIGPYIAVALQTTVRHCARGQVEKNLVHIGNMVGGVHMPWNCRAADRAGEAASRASDEILPLLRRATASMAAEIQAGRRNSSATRRSSTASSSWPSQGAAGIPRPLLQHGVPSIPRKIYKHRKNVVLFVEPPTAPGMYDQWVKTHGDTLDTFPVATEIGNIGGSVGVEGRSRELPGFALNGAEILYRLPEPWVSCGSGRCRTGPGPRTTRPTCLPPTAAR
jgi:hypothetical protein